MPITLKNGAVADEMDVMMQLAAVKTLMDDYPNEFRCLILKLRDPSYTVPPREAALLRDGSGFLLKDGSLSETATSIVTCMLDDRGGEVQLVLPTSSPPQGQLAEVLGAFLGTTVTGLPPKLDASNSEGVSDTPNKTLPETDNDPGSDSAVLPEETSVDESVRKQESTIKKSIAAMLPTSRRVCCDLAARTILNPKLDLRNEFMASFARAAVAEGITSVSAGDPFLEIVLNDLGPITDTVLSICELAPRKATEKGSVDVGEWFKELGFGKKDEQPADGAESSESATKSKKELELAGYGLSPETPICTGIGPRGANRYFRHLRCPKGETVSYTRIGAIKIPKESHAYLKDGTAKTSHPAAESAAYATDVMIDKYQIECACGEHKSDAYVDMYDISMDRCIGIPGWSFVDESCTGKTLYAEEPSKETLAPDPAVSCDKSSPHYLALDDPDKQKRLNSATELINLGNKDEKIISVLLVLLDDPSADVWNAAEQALGRMGAYAFPAVDRAMQGTKGKLRHSLDRILGRCDPARALQPMLDRLQAWHVNFRDEVQKGKDTHGSITPDSLYYAFEHLEISLHTTTQVLGNIGDSRVVEPLIKILRDPFFFYYAYHDPNAATEVIYALEKIGDARGIEAIRHIAESPEWAAKGSHDPIEIPRHNAQQALKRLGQTAKAADSHVPQSDVTPKTPQPAMKREEPKPATRRRGRAWRRVAMALLVLTITYLFGFAPLFRFLPAEHHSEIAKAYAPVVWLAREIPVDSAVKWWCGVWGVPDTATHEFLRGANSVHTDLAASPPVPQPVADAAADQLAVSDVRNAPTELETPEVSPAVGSETLAPPKTSVSPVPEPPASSVPSPNGMRIWTDLNNRTLEAELVHADESTVRLRMKTGTEASVPIQRLSNSDHLFASNWRQQHEAKPTTPEPTSSEATPSQETRRDSKISYRAWTLLPDGRTVEAELVESSPTGVRLRLRDGREGTIPLERLSDADQKHLQNLRDAGSDRQ